MGIALNTLPGLTWSGNTAGIGMALVTSEPKRTRAKGMI